MLCVNVDNDSSLVSINQQSLEIQARIVGDLFYERIRHKSTTMERVIATRLV